MKIERYNDSPNKWAGRTFYGKTWVPDVIVCHIAEVATVIAKLYDVLKGGK